MAYLWASAISSSIIVVDNGNANYSSENGVFYNKDKTELICYPAGKTDVEFVIPNTVTSIGYGSFYGCSALEDLSFPNSVTNIGYLAFFECTSLDSITIPVSVSCIGEAAFSNCTSLSEINYAGTVAQWNSITKESDWNTGAPAEIVICSDGNVSL